MMRAVALAVLLAACGSDEQPFEVAGMLAVTTSLVHVTSDPPAIDCGNGATSCIAAFPAGLRVILHVTEIPASCDVSVFTADDSSFPQCKTFSAQCQFDVVANVVHEIDVSCTTYP